MSEDLGEAISLLRQKRASHLKQVELIDAALTALAAVMYEPAGPAGTLTTDSGVAAGAPARRVQTTTTRSKVVDLAEESDRDWSVGEMIAEYERRGAPFTSANADSALRAAIVTAMEKGQLHRTAQGRYRASKFGAPITEISFSNGQQPEYVETGSP